MGLSRDGHLGTGLKCLSVHDAVYMQSSLLSPPLLGCFPHDGCVEDKCDRAGGLRPRSGVNGDVARLRGGRC